MPFSGLIPASEPVPVYNPRLRRNRVLARVWVKSMERAFRGWRVTLASGWTFAKTGETNQYFHSADEAYKQTHRKHVIAPHQQP